MPKATKPSKTTKKRTRVKAIERPQKDVPPADAKRVKAGGDSTSKGVYLWVRDVTK